MAGIDRETAFALAQQHGLALARRKGVGRAYGVAVHGRRMAGGRGVAGVHGLVQHPAHGLLGRAERFARRGRGHVTPHCGLGQGVQHFGHCLGQGQGFQIDIAFERHGLLLGPMAPIAPTARINVFPASIAALRAKGKKDGLWRGRAAAIMKKRRPDRGARGAAVESLAWGFLKSAWPYREKGNVEVREH